MLLVFWCNKKKRFEGGMVFVLVSVTGKVDDVHTVQSVGEPLVWVVTKTKENKRKCVVFWVFSMLIVLAHTRSRGLGKKNRICLSFCETSPIFAFSKGTENI
jgi:hypothetical protein